MELKIFNEPMQQSQFCGKIVLIGRPNVGKSTLLNHLVKQKLSITSRKPQTTRESIIGVHSQGQHQCIFIDTPGVFYVGTKSLQYNREALKNLAEVDIIVVIVSGLKYGPIDQKILSIVDDLVAQNPQIHRFLVVNKCDRIVKKQLLLSHLQSLQDNHDDWQLIAISAKTQYNLNTLRQVLQQHIPERDFAFDVDQITDVSVKQICAEFIREKIVRQLGDELPYASTVVIDKIIEKSNLVKIFATIYVERESQKAIVIGKGGERLKQIGIAARQEIVKLVENKVVLKLWVKVDKNWNKPLET